MNIDTPKLLLICGCNGAGKSTLTYSTLEKNQHIIYIDPDRIAKEEKCTPIEAGKTAIKRTKDFLKNKQDFLKESTLSSQSDLKLIKEAQKQGFFVAITYIGLPSANMAIKHVYARANNGGHFVPEEDVKRRYIRSLENLPHAIKSANNINIFDNSKRSYQHVASFENGELTELSFIPQWFKEAYEQVKNYEG